MKNLFFLSLLATGAVALFVASKANDGRKDFHLPMRPAQPKPAGVRGVRPQAAAMSNWLGYNR